MGDGMTLVNQPTARPTRKVLAVIVAGMVMGLIQALLKEYWPDHPFAPMLAEWDVSIQTAVMVAAGYLTRERAGS